MTFTKCSVVCPITESCSRHRAVPDKAELKNDKAGPTWFRWLHLRWLLVFLLTCFGGAFHSPAFDMEAALPLYVYPSGGQPDWAAAINAGGSQVGFIIANVYNGPGTDVQSEWTSVINSAVANGIAVYGYVYTKYGARDSATVDADIAAWFTLYPNVTGIFVDETASGLAQLPYYQARYNYIKSRNPNFQVVINPGTITDEGYMTACNVNTIFESNYSSWSNLTLPAWIRNYGEDRFYAIVYNVPTQSMESVVGTAKGRNFGKIFVTDAGTPSASLPDYFQAELTAIVRQRDDSILLTITSYGVSGLTARSATISWNTSDASIGEMAFGTSPRNLTTVVTDSDPAAATHTVQLTGLNPKTTYYYEITAFRDDGTSVVSTPVSRFKTRVR